MPDVSDLKVGDEVITNWDTIGVVKRITPTGRIVVDFGNYEVRYGKDGQELGNESVYYKANIRLLTPEKKQELEDMKTIRSCIKYFDLHHDLLTVKKAIKIVEVLKGYDNSGEYSQENR